MKARVDNSAFVAAHGRSPRGYGCWAFGTERNTRLESVVWVQGTFSKASAQAARELAARDGAVVVYTQS
jgi:hypothetical protein